MKPAACSQEDKYASMRPMLAGAASVLLCLWLGASLISHPREGAGALLFRGGPQDAAAADHRHRNSGSIGPADDVDADSRTGRHYLGMCLIVKDQHEDVREWVAHHTSPQIGASRIYVLDHLSDPPLNETLADYIADGTVHYTWWQYSHTYYEEKTAAENLPPKTLNAQRDMHTHCLRTHGHRHQFLGLLDSDEFLVITDGSPNVPDQLRRMMAWETIGGLSVFWRVFGSGGRETRPPEGVLKGFTKCASKTADITNSVKTIANTDYATGPHGHSIDLNTTGIPVVNEHFRRLGRLRAGSHPGNATWDHLAVNHYLTKSREEFAAKQARQAGDGSHRTWAEFDAINKQAVHNCTDAAEQYGPYPP